MTVSNLSNQLIVPITLWGSKSPTHCISSIILTKDSRTIITGCNDGQICIWDFNDEHHTLTPRSLLFGHTSAVLCLANGKQHGETAHFISSSESGEMSLWDLSDGRCIETVKLQHVHTNIHTYTMNHDEVRFFCNGYYAEILVIDGLTLEVLFTLNSKLQPDWISAIHVLKPTKSQDDVIIGLSIAGVMKVWTLSGHESKSLEPIYENESKPIRCLNALYLTCCCYNQRTLLIICAKYWQIYDVGDFAMLCSVDNRRGERWAGGDFLAADRVIIWNDVGKAYLYKLPVNKLKGKAITSCVPGNNEFHNLNHNSQPYLYASLVLKNDERLLCPPAMAFHNLSKVTGEGGINLNVPKVMLRGDSYGRVSLWKIPDIANRDLIAEKIPEIEPELSFSLSKAWREMKSSPCGIIDTLLKRLEDHEQAHVHQQSTNSSGDSYKLTSSVYIPALGRLVCGREDGSIIIVSANQTIMLQLLLGRHLAYEDWPHHQILYGHAGRVNTLIYPHHLEDRYEVAHLVSGGVDFSVCLWDIFSGTLLHRFSVHAGEITQMFVPPKECNSRVLSCICSVASDHSVALISLKERRCLMLASRHLFPISTIKWRPLDDFMIVGCVDGSVYVWQMETGHLDRVLHGMPAEEILSACDGNTVTTSGDRFVNPAIHLFRGLRHRNLAAIRQAAVRGLHNISAHLQQQRQDVIDTSIRSRSNPLLIQGLRTNPKDQESHILFFDVEALVVQLLSEEYDLLSPNTLENRGLTINLEYKRYSDLSCSPETQHKLTGLLAKMKDTAEQTAQKIQAKAESVGFKNVSGDISVGFYRRNSTASSGSGSEASSVTGSGPRDSKSKLANLYTGETHMPMEIARLLLSLLHAWGIDPDLDKVCEAKLGLLRPLRPVCFGMISKGGHMSLLLPTYLNRLYENTPEPSLKTISTNPFAEANGAPAHQPLTRTKSDRHVKIVSTLPSELQVEEEMARKFTSTLHWELSTSITTNHLLSLISMANTLMTMSNGTTFATFESNRRKLIRKLSRQSSSTHPKTEAESEAEVKQLKQQIRDGWSLIAALHCVLLPDRIQSNCYKRPLVEILARRWQDRCIEIREAAQALLLAELRLASSKGRRQIVEEWSPYLPTYSDQIPDSHVYGGSGGPTGASQVTAHYHHGSTSSQPHSMASSPITTPMSDISNHLPGQMSDHNQANDLDDEAEEDDGDDLETGGGAVKYSSNVASTFGSEGRRRQATAIILMGVIGAEYGAEIEVSSKPKPPPVPPRPTGTHLDPNEGQQQQRRRSVIEGFGGGGNYALARKTSKALSYLLLAPPSSSLPYHTSLRRAAIELIGRGFTVWEPYIDVSKILLALLEFSCSGGGAPDVEPSMVPSLSFGLPLTPAADSARTARHAVARIAMARPPAFITTLAKEVTRYNTLQQQQQASLAIIPHQTVLYRSRPEILRNMQMLIEKHQQEVYELIIETTDIIIYSLDHNALKNKGLGEMFPAICRFQNVTYCVSSKRVAVGARNGALAIYELKTGKSQVIAAHQGPVTACAFAPDGKHLASYCAAENKVSFWLTAVGLFGLGNAQTKCVKSHASPPMPESVRQLGPLKSAKLVWVSSKLLILLFADGKEHRFSI